MTFRISQFAVALGLMVPALTGVAVAQAPRYQSPMTLPTAPQPQILPVPAAITPNGAVVEDVIVRVNDQIISRSELERSQEQLVQDGQQGGASPAELADRQKNLLRDMIDQQLLLSRGKELNLNVDSEVVQRLNQIRKENNLGSLDDLEKAARQQGVSFEDFKANIRNGLITQQVVRDEVGRHLQMTQSQELAYYEAHKKELEQPEQVRLSEILVPTPADASDAIVAQAKAKAEDIAAKVKAGGKFEDIAKQYSGGPTATQGGDLGLFKRGALAKVLEDQTFGLQTGEATAPIRTRQGFVILKVTNHVAAGIPELKDVEPQLQEAMYSEQIQPALRAYLTKLREDAYVDIKAGFVDSGASPKQTKPVFTAYAPPVVKKKKVQEKKRFERPGRFAAPKEETVKAPAPVAATPAVASDGSTPVTTGSATAGKTRESSVKEAKVVKPKKIKREKVRFGQAPRTSLPESTSETAIVGGDSGDGAVPAVLAPGTSMTTPATSTTQSAPAAELDPFGPKTAEQKKTRFSARAKEQKVAKESVKIAKAKEKAAALPPPVTTEEKLAQQTQAAPLGLSGDTAKKVKKRKVKGAAKERLQQKAPEPKAPLPDENPYKAPDRGTPNEGKLPPVKPAVSSDKTTLPAADAPAPGTEPSNPPVAPK